MSESVLRMLLVQSRIVPAYGGSFASDRDGDRFDRLEVLSIPGVGI